MLILTRRVDERVLIGKDITIQVIQIRGGQVRLGIAAPPDMKVYREELLQKLQQEAASGVPKPPDRPPKKLDL